MKLRKMLSVCMAALIAATLFTGCGSSDGPDDKPIKLEPAGNVVSKYTKDAVDHSSMPEAETRIVRLHYRRNDDTANDRAVYAPWNV